MSAERIRWENGFLHVPVYNLGVAPLQKVNVRLLSKRGIPLAKKTIETLPPIKNWKLGDVVLDFEILPEAENHVEADGPAETTRQNNRAIFQAEKSVFMKSAD